MTDLERVELAALNIRTRYEKRAKEFGGHTDHGRAAAEIAEAFWIFSREIARYEGCRSDQSQQAQHAALTVERR